MKRLFAFVGTVMVTVGVAAPSAEPPPALIARGVGVSGVKVGGLTSEQARVRIRLAFERPLRLAFRGQHWRVSPLRLGATADVDDAVTRALRAPAWRGARLAVSIDRTRIEHFARTLDRHLSYAAANAELVGLDSLRPVIAEGRPGLRVQTNELRAAVASALHWGVRTPLRVPVKRVQPEVTRDNFGPVIVILRGSNKLLLYRETTLERTFSVATGRAQYPTPLGTYAIVDMQRNPWWRPPHSDWAEGLKPIPPGPGNPLGTRWMGTSAAGVGVHGTPDAASVGYSASHGCVRMYVPDAEWLFQHVRIGTPVVIVSA